MITIQPLLKAALLLAAVTLHASVQAAEMPPKNPYLADSSYSMGHGDSAQQDALPQAGPSGPSRTLTDDELQYVHTGPGFFGIATSGVYGDGERVFWGNGLDRIVKLDYDSHEIISEYFFPGVERYDSAQAEESIASFNDSNDGIFAIYNAFSEMQKLRNLSNLYTILDADHTYYVGSKSGLIMTAHPSGGWPGCA